MSLKMAPFDRPRTTYYQSAVVTIALSCIISEIKRDIGQFFIPPHSALLLKGPRRNIAIPFVKIIFFLYLAVSTGYWRVTDRRTEKQTDILQQQRISYPTILPQLVGRRRLQSYTVPSCFTLGDTLSYNPSRSRWRSVYTRGRRRTVC